MNEPVVGIKVKIRQVSRLMVTQVFLIFHHLPIYQLFC